MTSYLTVWSTSRPARCGLRIIEVFLYGVFFLFRSPNFKARLDNQRMPAFTPDGQQTEGFQTDSCSVT